MYILLAHLSQIAGSQNKVYLSANSLMLNIQDSAFDDMTHKVQSKK